MQALEAVGASSEQTVFVGDRVDTDVMAAKAVSCRSVLVRTGAFKMFENRANEADLVLDSIADLPAAIDYVLDL
jgi:NagD protein